MNPPQRIAVIGISGSGKSTFARNLAQALSLPLYHADSVEWMPNWKVRPEAEVLDLYEAWVSQKEWVIEGWVDSERVERLNAADLVIDLDYSRWRCTRRELNRMVRGAQRPELPSGCTDRPNWKRLMTVFWKKERPTIVEAMESASIKEYLRFTSPSASEAWLRSLS